MNENAATSADEYFIHEDGGSRHRIFPGVTIRTIAGQGMLLSVVHLDPDSVVEEHSHPHEQMGYLVSGCLRFTIGGITRTLGPGESWRIPGGVVHKVVAVGGPAVAIDVFHPIREEYL